MPLPLCPLVHSRSGRLGLEVMMGRRPLVRISLPVLLLLLAGCTDWNDMPQAPFRGGSRIYGVVTGGSGPVFRARVVAESPSSSDRIEARTEADGSYEMLVPPGDYYLMAECSSSGRRIYHSHQGVTQHSSEADTTRFPGGEGEAKVDFRLGGLLLYLHLPPGIGMVDTNGDHIRCFLQDPIERETYEYFYGSAGDSVVVFDGPLIIPGTYILRIEQSYEQYVWLPPTIDRGQAERIEIRAGETVYRSEALPVPAVVRGRLTGAWTLGENYSIDAILYGGSSTDRVSSAEVAPDGTFEILLSAGGAVRARFTTNGAAMWLGGASYDDATVFDLSPGAILDLGEIQTCGIRCTLVEFPGPEPDDWSITVVDDQERWIGSLGINEALEGLIPLARPGVCRLRIDCEGSGSYRQQWYDRGTDFEHATPVTVSGPGDVAEVQVHLEKGGSIAGRVVYMDGSPANDVWIRLRTEGEFYADRWPESPDAAFAFNGLQDEEYRLSVETHWGYYFFYPGTAFPDSAETISIADAGDVNGILFRLPTNDARQPRFVGAAACEPCHQSEAQGQIYVAWALSAHARATNDLDAAQREDDLCLACHTTGFGRAVAPGTDRDDLHGVQCEACHGPGSAYRTTSVMQDPVESVRFGLVMPKEADCVACHRGSLPRECWGGGGATPGFDFTHARAKIKHQIPG